MRNRKVAKFFAILSSIIIVVCIVVLGVRGDFPSFHRHKNKVRDMNPKMAEELYKNAEKYSQLEPYGNTTITGTQVKSGQDTFYKYNIDMIVKTSKDSEYNKYTISSRYNIIDPNNNSFIRDDAKFLSNFVKDNNGNIVDVKFTEVK